MSLAQEASAPQTALYVVEPLPNLPGDYESAFVGLKTIKEYVAAAAEQGQELLRRAIPDLYGWPEQREIADSYRTHVQNDAVEIEEDPFAQFDIRSVVALERRLHPYTVASLTEQVADDAATSLMLGLACAI